MQTLLLLLLLELPVAAQAATDTACLVEKYRSYTAAQEDWQRSLTELMIDTAPQYADVASQFMEDQLIAIERNRLTVEWLANNAPSALRAEDALTSWPRIDEETAERIEGSSNRYRELVQLGEQARTRPAHPDGDGLRALMREEITRLPRYETLFDALMSSIEQAEAADCR